jgi:5-methylcytosine-specific restriction endonuclease McrA
VRTILPLEIYQLVVEMLFKRDGDRCVYCGLNIHPNWQRAMPYATLDHVFPVSKGGSDDLTNLVLACGPCNNAKADKVPEVWFKEIWGENLENCPYELALQADRSTTTGKPVSAGGENEGPS